MKCLTDLFVFFCQCLLVICGHIMAMLTKAVSWVLGLEPAQVEDNDSKELLVVVEQNNPSFSDTYSSCSFEVEDDSSSERDYHVISKVKKERVQTRNQDPGRDTNSPCGSEKTIRVQSCKDIPIRTKNANGVFYNDALYIGGGYVTNSRQSASTIFVYNVIFDLWPSTLPPSPLKWFSMTLFDGQLVLVGGKEVARSTLAYTNKLAVWKEKEEKWQFPIPPMKYARSSPIVISKDGYLVVAGGNKGSLDYNMEVYDSANRRWFDGPPLPLPCLMQTSAVVGDTWYLMSELGGVILQANIPLLIQQVVKKGRLEGPLIQPDDQQEMEATNKQAKGLWKKLDTAPPVLPFRIISFGEYLVALSHNNSNVVLHALSADPDSAFVNESPWIHLGKLAGICANASTLSTSSRQLFVFGGDAANNQYSHKLFKVSILTKDEALQLKKERPHVTIGTTSTISTA